MKPLEIVIPEMFLKTQIIVFYCLANPLVNQDVALIPQLTKAEGIIRQDLFVLEVAAGKIEDIKSILLDFFKEYSYTKALSIED